MSRYSESLAATVRRFVSWCDAVVDAALRSNRWHPFDVRALTFLLALVVVPATFGVLWLVEETSGVFAWLLIPVGVIALLVSLRVGGRLTLRFNSWRDKRTVIYQENPRGSDL